MRWQDKWIQFVVATTACRAFIFPYLAFTRVALLLALANGTAWSQRLSVWRLRAPAVCFALSPSRPHKHGLQCIFSLTPPPTPFESLGVSSLQLPNKRVPGFRPTSEPDSPCNWLQKPQGTWCFQTEMPRGRKVLSLVTDHLYSCLAFTFPLLDKCLHL